MDEDGNSFEDLRAQEETEFYSECNNEAYEKLKYQSYKIKEMHFTEEYDL